MSDLTEQEIQELNHRPVRITVDQTRRMLDEIVRRRQEDKGAKSDTGGGGKKLELTLNESVGTEEK